MWSCIADRSKTPVRKFNSQVPRAPASSANTSRASEAFLMLMSRSSRMASPACPGTGEASRRTQSVCPPKSRNWTSSAWATPRAMARRIACVPAPATAATSPERLEPTSRSLARRAWPPRDGSLSGSCPSAPEPPENRRRHLRKRLAGYCCPAPQCGCVMLPTPSNEVIRHSGVSSLLQRTLQAASPVPKRNIRHAGSPPRST
jgi:hypothetical protein